MHPTTTPCAPTQTAAARWANTVLNIIDRHQIDALVHTGLTQVDVHCADRAHAYDLMGLIAGTDWTGLRYTSTPLGTKGTLVIGACPVVIHWTVTSYLTPTVPQARGGRHAGTPVPPTTLQTVGDVL